MVEHLKTMATMMGSNEVGGSTREAGSGTGAEHSGGSSGGEASQGGSEGAASMQQLKFVVEALEKHSQSAQMQETGLGALRNMAADPAMRAAMRDR